MRLGIFGGTFDPVHYGHLLAAEQCREQCRLDEVWFVPAALPPHKTDAGISPGKARAEMLELAVAGLPQFRVSRIELERDGPSYTVDTLAGLREDDPARELFLILGADSLADFAMWREPRRIAELANILAVNRGRVTPDVTSAAQQLGIEFRARVQIVEMPGVDLTSTDIRRRVREGLSIQFMTPRAVDLYLRLHNLYRG